MTLTSTALAIQCIYVLDCLLICDTWHLWLIFCLHIIYTLAIPLCNCFFRKNKTSGKGWAKRQVRPYPQESGPWKGEVTVIQCFFGFSDLEYENDGHQADFGGWLPNPAVHAVGDWLETHGFLKKVCTQVLELLLLSASGRVVDDLPANQTLS